MTFPDIDGGLPGDSIFFNTPSLIINSKEIDQGALKLRGKYNMFARKQTFDFENVEKGEIQVKERGAVLEIKDKGKGD